MAGLVLSFSPPNIRSTLKEEEMTRGKGTVKKILSYSERQSLQEDKREAESLLKEAQSGAGYARGVDEGALRRQIGHLDKELHDTRAPKLGAVQKDAIHKEVSELAEKLKEGMPTRAEMAHPARYPGAVRKHMLWDKRNRENINRYKELNRRLEPEAPANYEELRRD